MNTIERASLLINREVLVSNVEFAYIKDKLLAYGLLHSESLEYIENERTTPDKIRRLLDILPNVNEEDVFITFVKILEEDYDWIADSLRKPNKTLDSPDASAARHAPSFENGCRVPVVSAPTETIQKSLIFGGVPFPPVQLVPRVEKVEECRSLLKNLRNGEFLIIHGMAGAGKSVLAAQVVRDPELLKDHFECSIHWLTIGRTDKDSLLTKMQALCERLEHGQSTLPVSIDQATERLRKLLMDNNRKKSLLVLDDVWRGEVIRAFDVGCRILLTTRDISISRAVQGRSYSVKLHDGFTKNESLTYLANSLNLNLQDLPEQAHDIYQESKGSPMVLSLLVPLLSGASRYSSLLRDRTLRAELPLVDVQRWEHYLKVLRDRGYTSKINHNSEYYDTIDEAIAMSINDLTGDAKEAFYDFVIFLDDVNIPAAVLQVLWNCTSYEMEERVGPLIAKSLLVQHVQEQALDCTVLYGVHDLLLDHLKSTMDTEQQTMAHRKLVNAYFERCKHDYSAIPNDNYIYWFLGYHLYKAECFDIFPHIYLNLPFISTKIRATGPSDLLNDFRKYHDYIVGKDGEYLKRAEDYTNFVRAFGDVVVQNEHVDIIQLALQQPKTSFVYLDGLNLARASKTGVYLECIVPEDEMGGSNQILRSTLLNYGVVTAACFAHDSRYLLSAISDGQIRLWEADSGKEVHCFIGHEGIINNLALSNDGTRFVSASSDKSAKVWDLMSITSQFLGTENRLAKTPSPRIRQDSWHNMFDITGQIKSDSSLTTYCGHSDEVLGAWFSENGALIVSCSLDKSARIWLSTAGMEMGVLTHPETVTTACFSNSGLYVATGCDDSITRLWSALSYSCLATFRNDGSFSRVLFLSFLNENSLVAVLDTEVLKFEWDFNNIPEYACNSLCETVTDMCYQCAAISADNQFLALASSKDSVMLYSMTDMKKVYEYTGHTGVITCLNFSYGSPPHSMPFLMSGSHDETVKVWNVKDFDNVEENLLFSSVLNAISPTSQPTSLLAVLVRTDNFLQVKNMNTNEVLLTLEAVSRPDSLALCSLSHSSTMLAWVTSTGRVDLASISRNESKVLGHHSDSRVSLLKFSPSDALLLTADNSGHIKVWKPDRCFSLTGPTSGIVDCFFSNDDSKLLVCGVDGSLQFWDLQNELLLAFIQSECELTVTCVDKTDNDAFIAQGTADKGVRILRVNFGTLSAKMTTRNSLGKEKKSPVRTCRFSKVDQQLAVGDDNGTVDLFDYVTGSLIASVSVHRSWVRDLQWCNASSAPFQLVSAGDRLVYLGLKTGTVTHSIPSLAANRNVSGAVMRSPWQQVSVNILQTVELGGRFAHKLYISQDGHTSTAVLSSGSHLNLKLIEMVGSA